MKTTVDKIVQELKLIDCVEAVYLFGSQAKGNAKPFSDIDICVLTSQTSDEKKNEILSLSSDKIDTSLFWDLPLAIRYKVIKEGKILFKKNPVFLHNVRVDTIKMYLDFKPILERRFANMVVS